MEKKNIYGTKDFEILIEKFIAKHKRRTQVFNLQLGQWGNADPMFDRIRNELLEEARKYPGDEVKKQELIDSAIEHIKLFY